MAIDIIGWVLVVALIGVGMAGAIIPILPGVLAVYAAFFVYGFFFGFEPFGVWFWLIQTVIVVAIFVADHAVSALGVKKFGGTKASVIGSIIGITIGPFVIPAFGLILGPFLGAFLAELLVGSSIKLATKAGIGSVVGLLSSMVVKIILQLIMVVLFIIWVARV